MFQCASVGSCLGQHGQQVKPSACFSHAGLWSLRLPSEVSGCECCGFCWELLGHLAGIALTTPNLAVLSSLFQHHLSTVLLPGIGLAVVFLPPRRGRWLRLPPSKGGSTFPHLLPALLCQDAHSSCFPSPAAHRSHL